MEQRELRDILLLPLLDRKREQRRTSPGKKYLARGAVLFIAFALLAGGAFCFAQSSRITAPDLIGLSEEQVKVRAKALGLRYAVESSKYSSVAKGNVLEQQPGAGMLMYPFTELKLVVSGGTGSVEIPYLIDEDFDYAVKKLEDMSLKVLLIEQASSQIQGRVIRTDPGAGSKAVTGDVVTVYISAQRELSPLKDYKLSGKRIALVALPAQSLEKDPVSDLSIRLSSLLQASGADVVSMDTMRMLSNLPGSIDAVLILSIREDASTSGIEIKSSLENSAEGLAGEISKSISERGLENKKTPWQTPARSNVDALYQAELSLGNAGSLDDSSKLNEDAYLDLLARVSYIGIGEVLGK